jgi:hypothetical protein
MKLTQGGRSRGPGLATLGLAAFCLAAGPVRSASADGDDDLVARVATTSSAAGASGRTGGANEKAVTPIERAKRLMAGCQELFESVRDYTCTFHKREMVNGKLTGLHIMNMKVRNEPFSVYVKFQQPHQGREGIYVSGQNNGKVLVHDVGVAKVLAGTMKLDPRGGMAMEDNRHPVTEVGIGHLIETLVERWEEELVPGQVDVTIEENAKVQGRPCDLIVSTHAERKSGYAYHLVKVYIDHELGVPIRFEAYDWPKKPGGKPELVEEYTYLNLKLNAGLREGDFDPNNKHYSFGRF